MADMKDVYEMGYKEGQRQSLAVCKSLIKVHTAIIEKMMKDINDRIMKSVKESNDRLNEIMEDRSEKNIEGRIKKEEINE